MSRNVVWFDIPVNDLDRAIRFYSNVMNVKIDRQDFGPDLSMGILPHSDKDGPGGCLFVAKGEAPAAHGPLLYFNAQDRLDEAIAQVEPNGGRILKAKHSIAPHGWRAVVMDSEGNRIALHSM